jgi:hypothetical protein
MKSRTSSRSFNSVLTTSRGWRPYRKQNNGRKSSREVVRRVVNPSAPHPSEPTHDRNSRRGGRPIFPRGTNVQLRHNFNSRGCRTICVFLFCKGSGVRTHAHHALSRSLSNIKGPRRHRLVKRRVFHQHSLTEVDERLSTFVRG